MGSTTSARLSTWQFPEARRRSFVASGFARAAGLGLLITLAQVVLLLSLGAVVSDAPKGEAYQALCRWDGWLYACIVRDGYKTTIPPTSAEDFETSNVGFFPGYPLSAYAVQRLSGNRLTIKSSLVLASQLAAWGFWTYWLLMIRRFRAPRQVGLLATLAVALHPASYYLVVSYSESLFLFSMLGFLYWLSNAEPSRRLWALPHGIVMSATRLGGLPVAFVPLIAQSICQVAPAVHAAWICRKASNRNEQIKGAITACRQRLWNDRGLLGRLTLVGFIASLGGLGFFAYCQWKFGYWDMYFWTQREGATVAPDWLWLLRPRNYIFVGSLKFSHLHWPDDVSRFCVALSVVLIAVMGKWELKRYGAGDRSLPQRLPFYLCAVGLCFLHAAGVSPILMQSFFRYSLTVHVLLLLALVHACGWGLVPRWLSKPNVTWLIAAFAAMAGLQLALAARYFTHLWVA
jgi:hypothetical protein